MAVKVPQQKIMQAIDATPRRLRIAPGVADDATGSVAVLRHPSVKQNAQPHLLLPFRAPAVDN